MPIWVAQLSLVGHKEKKNQYMKMDGTSVIEGGDLVGMREALDRRAGDQSASHTCVT